ncbi:zinc finger protein 135-like [Xiphias gladius]|uniref:zinc finger protein 135-like n=1 Tax=Xiphias gladius TaxID=8245 RepID=UPI001A984318|nr:zinc finger protein 135-like [Xiphias gladius]
MSTIQTLRAFVNRRLTAVIEEIFALLETTISNYEEEIDRQRRLLEDVVKPDSDINQVLPPGVRKLIVRKEDQQVWRTSLDREDPKGPHIKEEQEELCVSQNVKQLEELKDVEITKFPFTALTVKSEDDAEKAQSSQLHQRQTEENREAEPPASSSAQKVEPETDSCHQLLSLYCCESETEDSNDDWKETGEQESGSDKLKNKSTSDHNKSCTRERPFSCTVCEKRFGCKGNLHAHMRSHTGEKPFTCTVCNKSFSAKVNLKTHMRSHTGEKPFSCSMCNKSFSQKKTLVIHLRSHTGERPFSCSFCGKCFSEKGTLKRHIRVHTGEKPYSCSVCGRNFSLLSHVKSHKCAAASSVLKKLDVVQAKDLRKTTSKLSSALKYDVTVSRQSQRLKAVSSQSLVGELCPVRFVTMCKIQTLRKLVNQRLGTAVEEIFRLFETTIAEYEEEIERQRRLLEVVDRPVSRVNKADFTQLLAIKQELPSGQQESSTSPDQEDPEPPHVKEEQEELWSSHEREQLQEPEEDYIAKFRVTALPVKSEDDLEKAQSSQLHQRQTEENREAEPPASSSAQQIEPDSSDSETEYSNDEWKETREPQPGSTFVKHNEVYVIVEKCHCSIGKKTYRCSECGKKFSLKGSLQRHIRVHTGEKPFSCSICGKKFGRKQHLQEHVIIHTGEQPFSCTVCGKRFRYKAGMRKHMRAHTECVCDKMLTQNERLPSHMTVHRDKAAFSCSVCEKEFKGRAAL